MKLKNEALEKLYGTIVNCTIAISQYADSQMEKAFEECDRELANLQNSNDILEKSNGTLLGANLDLCSKNRDLKDRIRQLEKDLDDAKNQLKYFTNSRDDWRSRAKHEEEEKIEQVKRADNLACQVNKVLGEKFQLQKEIDQLKKDLDALLSRTHCAEDEAEQLKKDKEKFKQTSYEWAKRAIERGKKLNELTSQYQKLTIENKKLQDGMDFGSYEQGQTDLWEALQNVNDVKPWDISSFYPDVSSMDDIISWDMEDFLDEYKKWQEDIKKTYEQKETDRMREWLVDFCYGRVCEGCPLESKEYKCGCGYSFKMTDPSDTRIIPDKDIKRYYEKARGCGRYTLNMEETRKAIISKACKGFRKAVRDADTKITENLRKGCTFEAEVNVNKDMFEKLCGMKSEEEKPNSKGLVITTRGVTTANYSEATMNAIKEAVRKFEKSLPALDSWESTITGSIKVDDIPGKTASTKHEFEYGDAVRLPWRDYDYMYIGPYEENKTLVRMFDPKNHAMVTSHIGNVMYNGGKIIICDENDLRKIWKDKK